MHRVKQMESGFVSADRGPAVDDTNAAETVSSGAV